LFSTSIHTFEVAYAIFVKVPLVGNKQHINPIMDENNEKIKNKIRSVLYSETIVFCSNINSSWIADPPVALDT
jgi:predicted ATP-grasp superfamily ATP-dependent carboligase